MLAKRSIDFAEAAVSNSREITQETNKLFSFMYISLQKHFLLPFKCCMHSICTKGGIFCCRKKEINANLSSDKSPLPAQIEKARNDYSNRGRIELAPRNVAFNVAY